MVKETFSINIDSEMKERAKSVAESELRSVSNVIEVALKKYLDEIENTFRQPQNHPAEAMLEGKRIAKICKENGKITDLNSLIKKLVSDISNKNMDGFLNDALQVSLLADTSCECLIYIAEDGELKMLASAFVSGLVFVNEK